MMGNEAVMEGGSDRQGIAEGMCEGRRQRGSEEGRSQGKVDRIREGNKDERGSYIRFNRLWDEATSLGQFHLPGGM